MTIFPLDLNGDKKSDVLQTYNNGGNMGFVAYISQGNGSFLPVNTNYNQGRGHLTIFPIDLNNDGKDDVLQTWDDKGMIGFVAYLSQGNGNFTTINSFNNESSSYLTIFPMDIDGDGHNDVLQTWEHRRGKIGFISYFSQGDGTFKNANINFEEDSDYLTIFPIDIDGDGKLDVLQSRNTNGQLGFTSYFARAIDGTYKIVDTVNNATSKYITIFPMQIHKRVS